MNFEEFGKRVKRFGKDTVEEVQKMNEIRQLNGKVSDAKKQINNLYLEMGKKLYDQYKEAPLGGFESEMQTVSEKHELIEELKEQIRVVKGVVLCPCCNMEVNENERFCSNCGNKMPEVVKPEEDDEDAIVVDSVDVTENVSDEATETEDAAEAIKEAAEDTVEAAKDLAEDATEAVKEAAEDTAETVKEAAEDTAEAVKEAAEDTVEAAEDAAEAVEGVVEDAAETEEAADDTAGKAAEKAREAADAARGIAKDAMNAAKGFARDAVGVAKGLASDAADALKDFSEK